VDEHFKRTEPAPEQNEQPESNPGTDKRLDWETPELIVENVHDVTRGGGHANPKPDGAYYS
jgi:hypothetical protein